VAGVQEGAGAGAARATAANPSREKASTDTIQALDGPQRTASMKPEQDKTDVRNIDRRTFLKRGVLAGGLLAGAGFAANELAEATGESGSPRPTARPARRAPPARERPNILVIVVDQLRFPQWLGAAPGGVSLPPNIARLRRGAVLFSRHYAASNDCSPSRSALLTGLYTHQTGCMITGGSTLDPGFPTWGKLLREHGYRTWWYGKWHLTHRDNRWDATRGEAILERYGFAGGTFPSPDGAPGQGWRVDPQIAAQFDRWFARAGREEPWCTTVSFVNPHDIAWWYVWTDRVAAEARAPRLARGLPPNFETPQAMVERDKPRLQRSLQETAAASFGPVPFTGPGVAQEWLAFLDLYAKLQREVDGHVGHVLRTLQSRPEVASNTVVVFTSDHGEYGASHGLRGKGGGVYEEGIRVPLIVNDLRGVLTRAPGHVRNQLTSHVDVAPLLLTIASGSSEWRREPRYAHIAERLDLASILADPSAPGRPYVLHATDEIVTEFAVETFAAQAPLHVLALRTPSAKYALYSHWPSVGIAPLARGQETELYDYRTHGGRLELHNLAGHSPLEESLHATLQRALHEELSRPLPHHLGGAHARGFADYFSTATAAAKVAAAARRQRAEREVGLPRRPGAGELPLRRRRTPTGSGSSPPGPTPSRPYGH
jgi:arylsulfatase A-like enzyme